MIQRTGWDSKPDSRDLICFFKGGGYQSAGHQHLDAGHFELFFREPLVVDLGVYHLYGTPYDRNFNKRAAAHNILTVYDPNEKYQERINDGGQQYNERLRPNEAPRSLREIQEFTRNGRTIAAYAGADRLKPEACFLKSDLAAAYHDKIRRYSRSCIFLRTSIPEQPGLVVVYDKVEKREPALKSTFQLNTLLSAGFDGKNTLHVFGDLAQLRCDMLIPEAGNLVCEQRKGKDMLNIDGHQLKFDGSGYPQENGTRNLFSAKTPAAEDEYLTVFQPAEKSISLSRPKLRTRKTHFELSVGHKLLVLSRDYELTEESIPINVAPDIDGVLLAGFAPGKWRCGNLDFEIKPGENAACLTIPAGKHELTRQ